MMTEIETSINPDSVFGDLNLVRHRVGKAQNLGPPEVSG